MRNSRNSLTYSKISSVCTSSLLINEILLIPAMCGDFFCRVTEVGSYGLGTINGCGNHCFQKEKSVYIFADMTE